MKVNQQTAALIFALATGFSVTANPAEPQATIYGVKAEESQFHVQVGRAGLFKVFGHDHLIVVERFEGEVEWNPSRPESSRFRLDVDASSLRVAEDEVSEQDRAKIQADMESKALALPDNPHIRFESSKVEVGRGEGPGVHLKVTGILSLRGVSKPMAIPLTLAVSENRLTARGEVDLESGTWGVPEISAVGGAVKTKGTLQLSFEIVAVSE